MLVVGAPPDVMLTPCPGRYRGKLDTVADFITRGDVAEKALAVCSSQIEAIRAHKAATLANKGLPPE